MKAVHKTCSREFKLFLKHDFMNHTLSKKLDLVERFGLDMGNLAWALKRQKLLLSFTATHQCSSPEITDGGSKASRINN